MTTLRIHVTKEVLEQSAYCGIDESKSYNKEFPSLTSLNCAISVAVSRIMPCASVTHHDINVIKAGFSTIAIPLPPECEDFITEFDSKKDVEYRKNMTPFHFDVEVTDGQLNQIMALNNFNEQEFLDAINECKTMSLVAR